MKEKIYNKWRKSLLGFCLIASFLIGNSFNVLAFTSLSLDEVMEMYYNKN